MAPIVGSYTTVAERRALFRLGSLHALFIRDESGDYRSGSGA
ncbi:hypothetical protein [Chelatococcus sambhunathii]|nr:hypothetical protein [Chelatococcus sambhunathii]